MSKKNRITILIILLSVIAAYTLFWIFGGESGVEKFMFTADTSNVTEVRNFWGRLNNLSFLLSNHPYSLKGIIGTYGKIANENGWQITSGKDFDFNEARHKIEAVRDGQSLTINIERIGGADKLFISISYND